MNVLEGKLVAGKGKFAIVAARFNEFIVSKLIAGAEDTLVRHGVDTDDITLAWVPGAFEIPLAAQKLAQSEQYCAVICLGAVIRGSTTHYDYVCNEVSKGIAQVGLQTGVPVLFGVVTTEMCIRDRPSPCRRYVRTRCVRLTARPRASRAPRLPRT